MALIDSINSNVSKAVNTTYNTTPTPNESLAPVYPTPNGLNIPQPKSSSVVSSNTALSGPVATAKNIVSNNNAVSSAKSAGSTDVASQNATALTSAGTDNRYYSQIRLDGNGDQYTVTIPNPNFKQVPDSSQSAAPASPVAPTDGSSPSTTTTNPLLTRTDVSSSVDAPGGLVYKQFLDGTYARINLTTGDATKASAADFQMAQNLKSATDDLTNLKNGVLTPDQQSQIDSIKQQFASLIDKQNTQNANATGARTIAENMYGLGNSTIGAGEITKVINDGAQKIADLQAKQADAISKMKQAFENDDMNLLKQAYDTYNTSQNEVEKSITNMKDDLQKTQDKIDAANVSIATTMAKKYQDTDTPILPTDSPDTLKQKLQSSPTWQQNNEVTQSLSKEEAQFVGQMGLAGANISSILPSLGLGKAATATKVQILKSIVDNAQTLGVSPEEVAQSIIDKQAAGKTYQRLLTQGAMLSAAETKTEADFENVKKLGTKITDDELQTGIPLLQGWIRTGTLGATNSPALRNYLSNLTTTLTNYGRVVAGQTGSAGITAAANSEAQGLLDKGLSIEAVNSFIDSSAIPDMKNTILGYTTSLKSMDKAINTANGTVNPTDGILGSTEGSTPTPAQSKPSTSGQPSSGGYAESWQ